MTPNREKAQEFILTYIGKLDTSGENTKIYTDMFSTMTDTDFKQFMSDLESEEKTLVIVAPNFSKVNLSVANNLEIAKELKYNFFQKIWIESDGVTPTYLTPIPYMVVDLPIRRQAQLLVKKISIPEDNKSIDNLTGQPTGKSKGSKISYPETQVLAAMGLDNCLTELLKYRGGDIKGFNAMNSSIARTGGVSLDAISPFAGGVESTKTVSTILTSAHLKNNLVK